MSSAMKASGGFPKKVLVANRSEIACRVFQACRELGLRTVALCAPGDEEARHVTYADEVAKVTGYLQIPSVIEAARAVGADFIHPGYGFLSERPAFVTAVEQAGIQFIGPRAETMELLGGKIAAKELAARIGVPTLPWARVETGQDVKAAADRVGYPLLLKASAGGGGKGMRRVNAAAELEAAAESAAAEAVAAFGDGTLFLERLVENPRHIEIQVFGDGVGGGIHLFERECSLQRRHQKVWEEATAPHLSERTRNGLYEAALKLVREVSYRSAGTIEFLVDAEEGFYFLEMNTRLQVEHPVTELVTGVDLVHLQLELALDPSSGRRLQPLPAPRGAAIEVRVYAEDPSQGFVPTPGRVERLRWPTGAGIRVDSGIEEGQTVGTSFDSMLAKIIVHAPDRAKALARMRFALDETVILGLGTNLTYLRTLAEDPQVISGHVHTGYLGQAYASFAPLPSAEDLLLLAQARNSGFARVSSGVGSVPASEGGRFPSPWTAARGQDAVGGGQG
jgi:acetyl/propionyl-CoA carboxylase alpha subunit